MAWRGAGGSLARGAEGGAEFTHPALTQADQPNVTNWISTIREETPRMGDHILKHLVPRKMPISRARSRGLAADRSTKKLSGHER